MSIIKANKCEIEIQEQTIEDAGCKYMTVLSYEPEGKFSKEIITVVLSNLKPIIKKTIDLGNRIVEKDIPTTDKPKDVTTPEQLLGLEDTHE
jgi:hypothetical protein